MLFGKVGLVVNVDFFSDIRKLNSQAVFAKRTGMIILGGGLIKHHISNANLMVNTGSLVSCRSAPSTCEVIAVMSRLCSVCRGTVPTTQCLSTLARSLMALTLGQGLMRLCPGERSELTPNP